AIAALRKLSAPLATVIRDGVPRQTAAREVCPGDVLLLEAGDRVPADARLFESAALSLQEAALTGESTPVEKDFREVLTAGTPLADRRNMVHLGTSVVAGRGKAVVVAIGMETELGRIAGLLERQEPEPTPLQRRLKGLGTVLLILCLLLAALIFVIRWLGGGDWLTMLIFAVSLAVAAVPEGLPAVVTIALAIGLRRMARRNALIRTLPSVETLGSVTVICTDKTGTLTRNEMTVRRVLAGDVEYEVSGVGYASQGEFTRVGTIDSAPSDSHECDGSESDADLRWLLTIGSVCNHAEYTSAAEGDGAVAIGDPTEIALVVAARKGGIDAQALRRGVADELPFDSERKLMSVAVDLECRRYLFTKGAPESVLQRCVAERREGRRQPLTAERRDEILRSAQGLASAALRVLGFASRDLTNEADAPLAEEQLEFVGLVGMVDPPRDEAREAVKLCREAGIRPVMITGDHPATAWAIGRELGLTGDEGDEMRTGADLDRLSDADLEGDIRLVSIYARTSAEHKLRIVHALKRAGEVVGMTGDGVNDAPALKAADIGVAMGLTGVDVAREASDVVLTDDNFASIVAAVEEGRAIDDNIRKVLRYLLACNAGEVAFIFGATLLGWPMPLEAVQLLWINLVTDGPPALALAMERPERDVMRRSPRRPDAPVISAGSWGTIVAHGLLVAAASAGAFAITRHNGDLRTAETMAFCVLAFTQLFYSFACRSRRRPAVLALFGNPMLLIAIAISLVLQSAAVLLPGVRAVFEAVPLSPSQWGLILVLSLLPVTVIEISKFVLYRPSLTQAETAHP
ncbi:MAG TPA: cation-translocating P-type ATPase, partial [Planctomycetaceae bacterium]|nr:cation-translocating P-type ATPase [Planctomycetaceae bacterium]